MWVFWLADDSFSNYTFVAKFGDLVTNLARLGRLETSWEIHEPINRARFIRATIIRLVDYGRVQLLDRAWNYVIHSLNSELLEMSCVASPCNNVLVLAVY